VGSGQAQEFCLMYFKKHSQEKFLFLVSDIVKMIFLNNFEKNGISIHKRRSFSHTRADLSLIGRCEIYEFLAFFSPSGIKSLKINLSWISFRKTRLPAFWANYCSEFAVRRGIDIGYWSTSSKCPSMTGALELCDLKSPIDFVILIDHKEGFFSKFLHYLEKLKP